jgi:pyruvate dehydrogenase E2 component (dihydrolipoamide acetyltransferase)
MAVPVIMPKFEMSQEVGVILEWSKQPGEFVKRGQTLFVVETDKVTMDVESPDSGFLHIVNGATDVEIPVTSVVAYLLKEGEAPPEEEPLVEEAPEAAPAVPAAALDAATAAEEEIKITPVARRLAEAKGIDTALLSGSGPEGKITKEDVEGYTPPPTSDKVRAVPAARRLAREHDLPLAGIRGSGPNQRIQSADVQHVLASQAAQTTSQPPAGTVIPLQGMRKRIAERMQASYQQAPHVTFNVRADMSLMLQALEKYTQQIGEDRQKRVTLTALLVKVTALTLRQHPYLNSTLTGDNIHLLEDINIGVAVALPDGLIVPVIHHSDQLAIPALAEQLNDLAGRARSGALTPQDVANGTFTITNLGPFGVESFTAIINPGQSAILAIGVVQDEIIPVNGEAVIRPMMHMTLSADHRVVDGAVAAQFLRDLKDNIENPLRLLDGAA